MEKSPILPPFKRFCVTIGNLPSSYVDSMSYYECLMWLCKYLKDTVIPAVNENAEAVNELINWFNNLDVQEEIDDKLDRMVEDGTLAEIINQEIFGEIQEDIADIQEDITAIDTRIDNLSNEKIITVGDSWGDQSGEWTYLLKDILIASIPNFTSNDMYIWNESGASSVGLPNLHSYLQLMQAHENDIEDKTKVTKIVLAAGYNDHNFTFLEVITALQTFQTYCRTTYPNAKVYYGMIGWDNRDSSDGILTRATLAFDICRAYMNMSAYGGIYMQNVECIMRNYVPSYWSVDRFHPASTLTELLARQIYNCLFGNGVDYFLQTSDTIGTNLVINKYQYANETTFTINNITVTGLSVTPTSPEVIIPLGGADNNIMKSIGPASPKIHCDLLIAGYKNSARVRFSTSANLYYDGQLKLEFFLSDQSYFDTIDAFTIKCCTTLDTHML